MPETARDVTRDREHRDKVDANRCVWCNAIVTSTRRRQCPPCAEVMGTVPSNVETAAERVRAARRKAHLTERLLLLMTGWQELQPGAETSYWKRGDAEVDQALAVRWVLREQARCA